MDGEYDAQGLGDRLRTMRGDRSQREIASAMHESQSWYSRLETGQSKLTIEQLVRLARVLEVSPWALIAAAGLRPTIADLSLFASDHLGFTSTQREVIQQIIGMMPDRHDGGTNTAK